MMVTPFDFGAVGGGADDQIALTAMFAALGPDVEAVIDGAFVHSGLLGVTGKSRFVIRGGGTLKMVDGAPVSEAFGGLRFIGCTDFVVEGITIDGNRATRTPAEAGAHLLNFRSCHGVDVIAVKLVNGCTDGVYAASSTPADPATHSTGLRFIDCEIDNCFRNNMALIQAPGAQVIRGRYTNANGMAPGAGIDLESNPGDAAGALDNITFEGVHFGGNEGAGLQISSTASPSNIRVIRPTFKDNAKAGVIWGATSGVIEDATFDGSGASLVRGVIDVPANSVNGDVDIRRPVFLNQTFGVGKFLAYTHSGSAGKVRTTGLKVDTCYNAVYMGAADCSCDDAVIGETTGDAAIISGAAGHRAKVRRNRISKGYGSVIRLSGNDVEASDNTIFEPSLNGSGGMMRALGPGARFDRNVIYRCTVAAGYGIRLDASFASLQDNLISGFTGNPLYLTGAAATETVGIKRNNFANGSRLTEN